MFYPDSFPKHFIETSINILTMQDWTMHVIVWKIRMILLQIFVWIVDLKVRERSTEYLKKDIKYRRVTIEVHVWKICCHKRLWQKDRIAFPLGDDIVIHEYWADMSLPYVALYINIGSEKKLQNKFWENFNSPKNFEGK